MGSLGTGPTSEPIAIVGLSCKFAGDARNPEALWEMLAEGRSAWSEIPPSRFNVKGTHHPNHEKINATNIKGAHFIQEDVGLFDAAFFNLSAETASTMDPQFRLQLESAYEALENAGLPLSKMAGSNTSVFAGVFSHDYHEGLLRDEEQLPRLLPIGTFSAMSSNRISHFFDLRGASMTVDTGCSTTLVALHQAVASLRARESDCSIVSGANLLLGPDMFKVFGSMGMLSPDGRSYAFDSRANGYGRGEGVATIVIKRLDDALACGDTVRAVIRETCLNQDGRTETITTPSQAAQEDLMHECYRRAGLDPRDTQYFEAHGTGTPTGDPIEARAIAAVFRQRHDKHPVLGSKHEPLRIGSVKTNIGHTEAASGLASLIKVVLALEKGLIPPSINFKTPNPKLQLDEWNLKVPTSLAEWPPTRSPGQPRRASVNNFGYGGSNAHIILEAAPAAAASHRTKSAVTIDNKQEHEDDTTVLILSARDEKSCYRMVTDLKQYLQTRHPASSSVSDLMHKLSYTLGSRRTIFPWVSASQVRFGGSKSLQPVIQALDSPSFTPVRIASSNYNNSSGRRPRVGMVFTGQGAQWHAMGRELVGLYPVFRASIHEADRQLCALGAKWSLLEELLHRTAQTSRVSTTALSIPVCVAVQIALVRLLASWGITPTAVTAHSSGEIAAAYAAGALTLGQAMAVAYYRARLASELPAGAEKGGMVAVGLGAVAAQALLDRIAASDGRAVVACINSPESVTIAGDVSAVEKMEGLCKQASVFSRRLRVDTAYHSHHMQPIAAPYLDLLRKHLGGLRPHHETDYEGEDEDDDDDTPLVIFSSAVTGGRMTSLRAIASPAHWVASLTQPVEFVQAFTDMVLGGSSSSSSSTQGNVDVLLEVGPHTALAAPIREILSLSEFGFGGRVQQDSSSIPYHGCLVRNENAGDTMRSAAVNLLRQGVLLNMDQLNFPHVPVPAAGGETRLPVLTDLPSYPWNHANRHWQESRINRSIRARDQEPHDLLGSLVPGGNLQAAAVWRNVVRVAEAPWLRDHTVQGNIVYPGAGYVCLAIEGAKQLVRMGIHDGITGSTSRTAANKIGSVGVAGYRVRDVELLVAMVVPDSAEGLEVQTALRPVSDKTIGARGWRHWEVSSVTVQGQWTIHAKGLVRADVGSGSGSGSGPGSDSGSASSTPKGGLGLSVRPLSKYTRRVDPQDMFANLRSKGIYHGPLFQNTTAIEQDGRDVRSVTSLKIADTRSSSVAEEDLPAHHVLHPTTLDSVILSCYSASPDVGDLDSDTQGAKLPHSIQELWVSSSISREAEDTLRCHTSTAHTNAHNFQADAVVFENLGDDDKASAPVLELRGLVCQSMGGNSSRPSASATASATAETANDNWKKQLCTRIEWAPDLSLSQPRALAKLKSQLGVIPESHMAMSRDIATRLRRVCVYFCHSALYSLTPDDVANLEPHHVKFHRWMQNQIQVQDPPAPGGQGWWTCTSPSNEEREREISLAATQSVEGEMVCHLGPHLVGMLRGEKAPLEVMMEERLLYRYYANALRMGPSLVQLAGLLRAVVHKNPRARILEIGGGTGGATRHLLRALGTAQDGGGPRAASWHFTDISSGFFEAARAEFAEWSDILEFDKLDIEKDPGSQGFELGSYDIVVACEVLHATKSMARTMAHVHSLMKPGGTLLLMETTQDQIDIQFTFGLLAGWWLSEEPERQSSPSLSLTFCDRVLKGAGFTGVEFDEPDCDSHDMYSISVIMSRVQVPAPPSDRDHQLEVTSASTDPDLILVTSNKTSLAASTVEMIRHSIQVTTGRPFPAVICLEDAGPEDSVYSGKICIFLGETVQPILHDMDEPQFQAIKNMTISCRGLVWVTVGGAVECENPDASLSQGLLRTLRNERMGRLFISLDLEGPLGSHDDWPVSSTADAIATIIQSRFGDATALLASTGSSPGSSPEDFEYAVRDGVLLVPRLYNDTVRNSMVVVRSAVDWQDPDVFLKEEPLFQEGRTLRLEAGIPGLLDTLAFSDDESQLEAVPLSADMVEIQPRAYGLNFRDVMVAMGQLRERVMGLECSGIVTHLGTSAQLHSGLAVGDRVMALLLGPFASRARVSWHGVVPIPPGLSFEDAASLPMVFSTAYVALVEVARLRKGQTVLIHAAAGGVGQAAVMLAKHFGLGAGDIYATVGSQEKRDLLIREYGISDDHIFSSRNVSFAPAVLAATGGRGVDVVLNSLAGPLLQASFGVLAAFGHLVEIGKKDLEANSLLEMGVFSRVASYSSLDMMTLLRYRGGDTHRILCEIARLFRDKALTPVRPVTAYSMGDTATAFRLLQTCKHKGKIVLSTKPDEQVKVRPPSDAAALAAVRLKPDASYLLVGGTGGLGRSIAHWMIDRGARNLVLLSRSAGSPETNGAFVAELRAAGCRVVARSCDVSVAGQLARALRSCEDEDEELPPIRGVIQGAMLLQDSVLEHMTLDDWRTCVEPKVCGTRNLHMHFSGPPQDKNQPLDFFIMLSSFSGILGIVSQANYAAGSAYQDALAHWRSAHGLPGVAIDLGAVKGVGYVAETAGVAGRMRTTGETLMLAESAVQGALQAAMAQPVQHPQILLGLNTGPGPQWDPEGKSQMARDARFTALRYRESRRQQTGQNQTGGDSHSSKTLSDKLSTAASREKAAEVLGQAIAAKLAVIFMLPADEIDLTQPPAEHGIDSLVAVELRNMLVLQAGAEVSIFNIMQSVSLAALAMDVALKSRYFSE